MNSLLTTQSLLVKWKNITKQFDIWSLCDEIELFMMDKFQMLESERFSIDPCGEIHFYALDGKKAKTKSIHKIVVKYHQASSVTKVFNVLNLISPKYHL